MLTSEEAELEKAAANKFRARPMPDYSKLAQVENTVYSLTGQGACRTGCF